MAQNTQNDYNTLKRRNRRRLVGAVVMVLLAVLILWQVLSKTPPARVESENIVFNDGSGTIEMAPIESTDPSVSILPPLDVVSAPIGEGGSSAVTIGSLNPQPSDNTQTADAVVVIDDEAPANTEVTPVVPPVKKPVKEPITPPKSKIIKPVPVEKPREVNPQDILDGKLTISAADSAIKNQAMVKTGQVVIQVAALSDATKAAKLKERLSTLGIAASISQVNTSKGGISRVRVGPFSNKAEAQKTLQRLNNAGIDGIVVSQ